MASTPPSYNLAQRGHASEVQFGKDGLRLSTAGSSFLDRNEDASSLVNHSGLPASDPSHYVTQGQFQNQFVSGGALANATAAFTTVLSSAPFTPKRTSIWAAFEGSCRFTPNAAGATVRSTFRLMIGAAPIAARTRTFGHQSALDPIVALAPSSIDIPVILTDFLMTGLTPNVPQTISVQWQLTPGAANGTATMQANQYSLTLREGVA